MKWRPGQYAYLRLPSVSLLVSHPFTITSLCTPGLPDHVYAPPGLATGYRHMTFLLRPSSSYALRLLAAASSRDLGDPFRAFLDGPYGGMSRALESFDHVLLIAGGSGITALMSQLVGLVAKMREGKSVTRSVRVVWAVKRAESLDWFGEELRLYRDMLGGLLKCELYVTAEREERNGQEIERADAPFGPTGGYSTQLSARREGFIQDEAASDIVDDKELRIENEDAIAPLPQAHLRLVGAGTGAGTEAELGRAPLQQKRIGKHRLTVAVNTTVDSGPLIYASPQAHPHAHFQQFQQFQQFQAHSQPPPQPQPPYHPQPQPTSHPQSQPHPQPYNFPSLPTDLQSSLPHFKAPSRGAQEFTAAHSWTIQHGRPDIRSLLKQGWRRDFGARNCVFVCGPPGMRRDVASGVADAQRLVWSGVGRRCAVEEAAGQGKVKVQEVWLHAENFAL